MGGAAFGASAHILGGPPALQRPGVPADPALDADDRTVPQCAPAGGTAGGALPPAYPNPAASMACVADGTGGVPHGALAQGAAPRPAVGAGTPFVVAAVAVEDRGIGSLEDGVSAGGAGIGKGAEPPCGAAESAYGVAADGIVPSGRAAAGAGPGELRAADAPVVAASVAVEAIAGGIAHRRLR